MQTLHYIRLDYIYIHTHIHTYTYIHIYTYNYIYIYTWWYRSDRLGCKVLDCYPNYTCRDEPHMLHHRNGWIQEQLGDHGDIHVWLVVEPPLWKIWARQWEGLSHILWTNKNVSNHQPNVDMSCFLRLNIYTTAVKNGTATCPWSTNKLGKKTYLPW